MALALLHRDVIRWMYDQRWTELRSIQEQAIPIIIQEDGDLIISARTASGKTEAAFLPILSAIADNPQGSVRVLYVGPLRALINDQFRRMDLLCAAVGIPVHRWHGEVGQGDKRKLLDEPGGVLLITPESIESLFINRADKLQYLFKALDFVVVDELHVFTGCERGMHLRSLLSRLERVRGQRIRRIGLSATLGEPDLYKQWFRPTAPERVRLVTSDDDEVIFKTRIHVYEQYASQPNSKRRGKDYDDGDQTVGQEEMEKGGRNGEGVDANGNPVGEASLTNPDGAPNDLQRDLDLLLHHKTAINLVFANGKMALEKAVWRIRALVAKAGGHEDRILIHHGSLAREIREEAERLLQQGGDRICFCSSTLELGVDIGSARAIGHLGAPFSVSSFSQRLGRSGRKDGEPAILRQYHVVVKDHAALSLSESHLLPEFIRGIALTQLHMEHWCEPPVINGLHGSTVIHQVFSIITETAGLRADQLYARIAADDAFTNLSRANFAAILRSMAQHHLIIQIGDGSLVLDLDGEAIARSREFYPAFATSEMFRIVHGDRFVGELDADQVAMANMPGAKGFRLGGKCWGIVSVEEEALVVVVVPSQKKNVPIFRGEGGAIHDRVIERMQRVLASDERFAFLDDHARRMLAYARKHYQLNQLETVTITGSRPTTLWTWKGTRTQRAIGFALQSCGLSVDAGSVSVSVDAPSEDFRAVLAGLPEDIGPIIRSHLLADKTKMVTEKFDRFLPQEIIVDQIMRFRLDLSSANHLLHSMRTLPATELSW